MSDIGSLGGQLANAGHAAQARASVRPESPPPLTVQNAVAQTLNTPQTAVMQSPEAGNAEWQREAHPDGHEQGAQQDGEQHPPPREQVNAFLEHLNQQMSHHHTHLQFELTGGQRDWRIRIVDQDTHKLVRWISWEETQAFARSLEELEAQSVRRASSMGGGLLRVTV